jgi:hypothetical protein
MHEAWPNLRPGNRDAVWNVGSDVQEESASFELIVVLSLIESMLRCMWSAVEAQEFWTLY